jgi:hypothetical protein
MKVGRIEVHLGRNVAPGWGLWRSGDAMVVIALGPLMAVFIVRRAAGLGRA